MKTFEERELVFSRAEQEAKLTLCGIDAAIYGDEVDPSSCTALAILEAQRNEITIPGALHAGQRLILHRPIMLEEPLVLSGGVSEREAVERGEKLACHAQLTDSSGEIVLTSFEELLIPSRDKAKTDKKTAKKPGESKAASESVTPKVLDEVTFVPSDVKTYCGPDVDPIHIDPAAAEKAGFRAPIIGGELGIRHLVANLWKVHTPTQLSVFIRFLRPVFWDDICSVVAMENDEGWSALALTRDGKDLMELRIDSMSSR